MNALSAVVRPLYAPIQRAKERKNRRGVSGWWILPAAILGLGFWIGVIWLILSAIFG